MRQWRASIGDRRNPSDGDVSWVAKPRTIVGVVGDVHLDRLDLEAKPELYVPFTQIPNTEGRPTIVVRTAIDPAAVTAALRNAVSGIDNALPLDQVKSMQQLVSASVGQPRFRTIPLAPFSILALVIASVGIYGLMNYRVSQQIREFGIRLAIGEGDVLRLVLRRATVLIAAGLGLGRGTSWVRHARSAHHRTASWRGCLGSTDLRSGLPAFVRGSSPGKLHSRPARDQSRSAHSVAIRMR
jgi:putative ABC transport system permease protein